MIYYQLLSQLLYVLFGCFGKYSNAPPCTYPAFISGTVPFVTYARIPSTPLFPPRVASTGTPSPIFPSTLQSWRRYVNYNLWSYVFVKKIKILKLKYSLACVLRTLSLLSRFCMRSLVLVFKFSFLRLLSSYLSIAPLITCSYRPSILSNNFNRFYSRLKCILASRFIDK